MGGEVGFQGAFQNSVERWRLSLCLPCCEVFWGVSSLEIGG